MFFLPGLKFLVKLLLAASQVHCEVLNLAHSHLFGAIGAANGAMPGRINTMRGHSGSRHTDYYDPRVAIVIRDPTDFDKRYLRINAVTRRVMDAYRQIVAGRQWTNRLGSWRLFARLSDPKDKVAPFCICESDYLREDFVSCPITNFPGTFNPRVLGIFLCRKLLFVLDVLAFRDVVAQQLLHIRNAKVA